MKFTTSERKKKKKKKADFPGNNIFHSTKLSTLFEGGLPLHR